MPAFELSPRDRATIAQLEESFLPAEPVSDFPPASDLYGNLPIEERPIPARRTTRYNPRTGRMEPSSAWVGAPVSASPFGLHRTAPRAEERFLQAELDPQAAAVRYESLLRGLAPFMDEVRRNQQALEAIPFVAR